MTAVAAFRPTLGRRFAAALAIVLVAAACRDATSPRSYTLPPADESLDPAALRLGRTIYACGAALPGGVPSGDWALVDVMFGRRSEADPIDRPLPEMLDAVRAQGGQVLHSFHFPAVRAYMPVKRLLALHRGAFTPVLYDVPDPRRYDWLALVQLRGAATDADLARVRAVGGRVVGTLSAATLLAVELLDRSYPVLRAGASVELVEAESVGCLAANRGA